MLLYRVGFGLDRQEEPAVRGLGRSLQAVALDVVKPAVIGAGDAAFLNSAIEERCAAMRAVVLDGADASALVLEEHQVLAEQADMSRGLLVRQLRGRRHRLPVAPQELAHRRTWSHLGELV